MSILTKNCHTWYIGGVDSKPRFWLLKFRPQNPFWGNLGTKIQSSPFYLKIGTHSISRMLIPNPDSNFWNFDLKIHFWENLGPKIQICPFCLKIGTHSVSRMQISNPEKSRPQNPFWGKFWSKKSKLFIFQQQFSEFSILNPFLSKFGPKNSKLFVLPENWYTCYLEVADSYSHNSFLNSQP